MSTEKEFSSGNTIQNPVNCGKKFQFYPKHSLNNFKQELA